MTTKNKKLLIVWVHYHCGFKYHNTYVEVTENYNIRNVLNNFVYETKKLEKIDNLCIINIMEV